MVFGCLPLVVAGPGTVLVAAAPARPAHPVRVVACGPDGRAGEQVGDLVAGQGDLVRRPEAVGVLGGCGDGKGRGGEHGEGDPPVPGGPAADLVLIQAGQALPAWKILFDVQRSPVTVTRAASVTCCKL